VIDEMNVKLKKMERQISGVSKDVSKTNKRVDLVRTEDEERKKREKNIIVRGVPENDQIEDKDVVEYILRSIECGSEIPKVTYIDRLGAKKQSPTVQQGETAGASAAAAAADEEDEDVVAEKPHHRPIRIKFEDLDAKKNVLKSAPKIRLERTDLHTEDIVIVNMIDSKQVFIVPDKTKMEREADVELPKNLDAKRKDFPQDKWKIRRGKIVKVPPSDE
jgi:hypothetical protein